MDHCWHCFSLCGEIYVQRLNALTQTRSHNKTSPPPLDNSCNSSRHRSDGQHQDGHSKQYTRGFAAQILPQTWGTDAGRAAGASSQRDPTSEREVKRTRKKKNTSLTRQLLLCRPLLVRGKKSSGQNPKLCPVTSTHKATRHAYFFNAHVSPLSIGTYSSGSDFYAQLYLAWGSGKCAEIQKKFGPMDQWPLVLRSSGPPWGRIFSGQLSFQIVPPKPTRAFHNSTQTPSRPDQPPSRP